MGRRCYVFLRLRYNGPIRRCGDVPFRRFDDVPSRRHWVFHLGRTCDVAGTCRETTLRGRDDVLNSGWVCVIKLHFATYIQTFIYFG